MIDSVVFPHYLYNLFVFDCYMHFCNRFAGERDNFGMIFLFHSLYGKF